MRKLLTVMVVALMAAIGFAAPAQAAPVSKPYSFAYGASTATGTVNFTDGYTASVSGVVHAASDRRQVCAVGFNGDVAADEVPCSPWTYANGPNQPWGGSMRIPLRGGVVQVVILMYDGDDKPLDGVICSRGGCSPLEGAADIPARTPEGRETTMRRWVLQEHVWVKLLDEAGFTGIDIDLLPSPTAGTRFAATLLVTAHRTS